MVGNAPLRKVVSADAFGTVARPDLIFTVDGTFLVQRFALHVVQAGTQNSHRAVFVFELRPLVLARNDKSRRKVRDTHGGFRFVDVLTARARRAVNVDFQIFFIDFQVDFLGFGQNGDRRGGRVNAPRRFRFGNALDTVNTRFKFQLFKHGFARNGGGRFFVAAQPRIVDGKSFKFPPLFGGIVFVHAEQFGGKQSGFFAARPRADFQNRVFFVNGVFGQQQDFQLFFQFGQTVFGGLKLLVRQRAHFRVKVGIVQQSLRVRNILKSFLIRLNRLDNVFQARQFLGQLDERFSVGIRAQQSLQFIVSRQNDVQFFLKAHPCTVL